MPGEEICSFCRRPQNEVEGLIPSPRNAGIYICDTCIEQGVTALREMRMRDGTADHVSLPKPLEIVNKLDEHVISQTFAKQTVAAAVYKHYKRRRAEQAGLKLDVEIEKSNILMLGPSGCGKTEIARTIARILGVPFFIQDCTKLTQAGYVGEDVDVVVRGLLEKCAHDPERAKWGIVVLDEIDKIARKSGRDNAGYRDITGEGVQQALLKLVEGDQVTVTVGGGRMGGSEGSTITVDTTNILFIGMGSFDGIQDVVSRRINKSASLGFGGTLKKEVQLKDVYLDVEEQDILEFGFISELAGRLPVITSVLPLTEEELIQVLTAPKNALVKQFRALYQMDGIDLQFEEEALRALAALAIKRKTGARALRGVLEKLLNPWDLRAPSMEGLRVLRLTKDFVEGKSEPFLIQEGKPESKRFAEA